MDRYREHAEGLLLGYLVMISICAVTFGVVLLMLLQITGFALLIPGGMGLLSGVAILRNKIVYRFGAILIMSVVNTMLVVKFVAEVTRLILWS